MQLVRFGDVFVDELSGWLHVCDKACDLQAEDDTGAFMVCPLTGRMHGRVAATWDGGACGGAMEDLVDSGVGEGGTAVDMRDADGDNAPDGGALSQNMWLLLLLEPVQMVAICHDFLVKWFRLYI